ncbi:MAG: copper homeostasis protein CutC [Rhodanobacteraceae bacterium]|nr:copper homeostasis protein CutC [Rhodanobacteraceae bacterium]
MKVTRHIRLEIAANSLASAVAAQEGGADRIELCDNLEAGGTTPSYGTIAAARDVLKLPLFVLVRPRAGDFLYDSRERDVMLRDIELCRKLGCDGVVIGALDADGDVDVVFSREMVAAAGAMHTTFHRAFDAVRDPSRALETIITLGCAQVLTSGGYASAPEGALAIAGHVETARGRLLVMAGAGITPGNVAPLVGVTGVEDVHASARAVRTTAMRFHNQRLAGLDHDWQQTDRATVRALRDALDGCVSR